MTHKPSEQTEPASKMADKETIHPSEAYKADHLAQDATAPNTPSVDTLPPEHGGQTGLEPTRYGDWEKKGRCTDF